VHVAQSGLLLRISSLLIDWGLCPIGRQSDFSEILPVSHGQILPVLLYCAFQYQEVISRKLYPSSMIINVYAETHPIGSAAHKNRTRTHLTYSGSRRTITSGDYPCLCLCFGFSQITLMRPFLLMILHFSQIGFTDDLTFILNPPFKKDRFTL